MSAARTQVRIDLVSSELECLRAEIGEWLKHRRNLDVYSQYSTQLDTLDTWLNAILNALSGTLQNLSPNSPVREVYQVCHDVDTKLIWTRHVWRYFADKFDQREDPTFKQALAAADEAVWSCYAGPYRYIQGSVRPAVPLPFIETAYTPYAIARDVPEVLKNRIVSAPFLQQHMAKLPLPIIGLPQLCAQAPWWLIYIGHEVGHHLQHDLDLIVDFKSYLTQAALDTANKASPAPATSSAALADKWGMWNQETFADAVSVYSLGPWAAWAINELLIGNAKSMLSELVDYPPAIVRLKLMSNLPVDAAPPGSSALRDVNVADIMADPSLTTEDDIKLREAANDHLALVSGLASSIDAYSCKGIGQIRTLCSFQIDDFKTFGTVDKWRDRLLSEGPLPITPSLAAPRFILSGGLAAWSVVSEISDQAKRADAAAKLANKLTKAMVDNRKTGKRAAAKRADLSESAANFANALLVMRPEEFGPMTDVVRFTVGVKSDWTVAVEWKDGPISVPTPIWHATSPLTAPESTKPEDRFLYSLCPPNQFPQKDKFSQMCTAYQKIFVLENYLRNDVEILGSYLFEWLLGEPMWQAICNAAGTDKVVELALHFDEANNELHRFPWELMYGPTGFLAQGKPMASVTRLVSQPLPTMPAAFQSPPQLLFVVGAALTDSNIRPGAEILGLLRQLDIHDLPVNKRVILSTTPNALAETVEKFMPDLVHFTCHGDIELGLEFSCEDRQIAYLKAPQLLDRLRWDDHCPKVVVLSACYSGATVAGVDRIGSLAADLVAGGIPAVIGMGGHVDDSACRLFTRCFGASLIKGDSLVVAVARGRRAAFLDGTPDTADWAFPVLFLGPKVDSAYIPVVRSNGTVDACAKLKSHMKGYDIQPFPVFCGRQEFFERYRKLFKTDQQPVLPICAQPDTPGLGRHRLLQELAAQALRDGHVPCLFSSKRTGWPSELGLDTVSAFAIEILKAITSSRTTFGLKIPTDSSVIKQLIKRDPILQAKLNDVERRSDFVDLLEDLKKCGSDLSVEVCQSALQEDFEALIKEARAAENLPLIGPNSRALLLLNYVHRYGAEVITTLFTKLIKGFGLGTENEPVPVIICYDWGIESSAALTSATDNLRSSELKLRPFSEKEDEDLLAYEQVLLFPDEDNRYASELVDSIRNGEDVPSDLHKPLEGKVANLVINHHADTRVRASSVHYFRKQIKGIPKNMKEQVMYDVALGAYIAGFLVLGDDEAILKKMQSWP